jgi:hypothetical protein
MIERHPLLMLIDGGTKPLALALQLDHLLIDVHELPEVVAGLATQRADPQVGQVQVGPGLVLELVEGALGQELELADQAAGLAGHLGKSLGAEDHEADKQDHERSHRCRR